MLEHHMQQRLVASGKCSHFCISCMATVPEPEIILTSFLDAIMDELAKVLPYTPIKFKIKQYELMTD